MSLLERIKGIKEADYKKHIDIIETLIDNDLLFIEDNLLYKITAPKSGKTAVFFARTGMAQIDGRFIKLESFKQLLDYLK